MRKILVFVNRKPARLLNVSGTKNTLCYLFPGGKVKELPVSIAFATFRNGHSGAVVFASDRAVSLNEILDAVEKLKY